MWLSVKPFVAFNSFGVFYVPLGFRGVLLNNKRNPGVSWGLKSTIICLYFSASQGQIPTLVFEISDVELVNDIIS